MAAARHLTPLHFPWEKTYVAAILETDDQCLRKRIDAAEEAILLRLTDLTDEMYHAEILEIEKALMGLNTLRRERLR
jgi:hypothetical protein